MGKFAAAAAAQNSMLDWGSCKQSDDVGGASSKALDDGTLVALEQNIVAVPPEVLAKINGHWSSKQVGKMLNEALSCVRTETSITQVKILEQALATIPFRKYNESAIVALKKGIDLDCYEYFIKDRIAKRYNLPQKHMDELLDSMYLELNQVSITEFAFQQEPEEGAEDMNNFFFCRMVVLRREKENGKHVLDLGYCFFKVNFSIGDERVLKEITEEITETVPQKFLFFTLGHDVVKKQIVRTVEEYRKVQLDWQNKDEIQDYFRFKAVQALSQDALQKGDDTEMKHGHEGSRPVALRDDV